MNPGDPIVMAVDSAELARRLGVRPSWVRAHARELGGFRLGTGPQARWRFELEVVTERLASRSVSERSEAPKPAARQAPAPRRAPPMGSGPVLLPIRASRSPLTTPTTTKETDA
jgi:hypothetical protein